MPADTVAVLVARLVSSLPAPDSPKAAFVTVCAEELTATACAAACDDDWSSWLLTPSRFAIDDCSTAWSAGGNVATALFSSLRPGPNDWVTRSEVSDVAASTLAADCPSAGAAASIAAMAGPT